MSADILIITKAFHFAAQKHRGHRRKGEDAEPYINHLAEVSWLLSTHTDGRDVNLIVAGLLHDSVEDVGATWEELEREFCKDIADLVKEVSDNKSLPQAERKQLQIERAPLKSDRAKMLTIADKISNLRATRDYPPVGWSDKRKQDYFDWAFKVISGCRGVNPSLEAEFDALFEL